MFFQLVSTITVNIVDKMMHNANLCVILHVKHNKISFLAVLTGFLILGKIQDGGQDGDGELLVTSQASRSATTHKIYGQTSLIQTPKGQNQVSAL